MRLGKKKLKLAQFFSNFKSMFHSIRLIKCYSVSCNIKKEWQKETENNFREKVTRKNRKKYPKIHVSLCDWEIFTFINLQKKIMMKKYTFWMLGFPACNFACTKNKNEMVYWKEKCVLYKSGWNDINYFYHSAGKKILGMVNNNFIFFYDYVIQNMLR